MKSKFFVYNEMQVLQYAIESTYFSMLVVLFSIYFKFEWYVLEKMAYLVIYILINKSPSQIDEIKKVKVQII